MRPAVTDDVRTLFEWRNLSEIVRLSSSQVEVDWDSHQAWFTAALANRDQHLINVVVIGGRDAGLVRFDRAYGNPEQATISAYLLPGETGQGAGYKAIMTGNRRAVEAWDDFYEVIAHVRSDNARGVRSFQKAGFVECRDEQIAGHRTLSIDRGTILQQLVPS